MRKKLLLVEDNTELLELLRLGLKEAGFTVHTATDGVQALRKARGLLPDVIVLDLVLPELDGFEVCQALKKDGKTSGIPVVVLTGLSSQFTRYAGMEAGADDYVTKPVTVGQLTAHIERCLAAAPERTTSEVK